MASQNLANLQATVNRFASDADFSPITIDGGMGPKTIAAVVSALRYASGARVADLVSTGPGVSAVADAGMYDQQLRSGDQATSIMQNVNGITTALNDIANALGLTEAAIAVVKPQTVPSAIPDKSAITVKAPASMGAFDSARLWFRQLSTAGQAGIGAGALILIIFGTGAISKKKKAGMAGGRW